MKTNMTAFQKLALLASGETPKVTFNVAEAQEITRAIKREGEYSLNSGAKQRRVK